MATERGDRYVLKKVSMFNAPNPVRRFTDEARIVTDLLQRGVPVAVPVLPNDGKACATDDDGAPHAVFPMLPKDGADNDPGLDPALFQNVGAAIARLHVALAGCPFGVESWEVGPGLLTAWWQTAEDRLPAAAVTELSARIRPRSSTATTCRWLSAGTTWATTWRSMCTGGWMATSPRSQSTRPRRSSPVIC